MHKLSKDFTLSRYGLNVRFVNEEDAEFIVKLRTDEKLGRYLHQTSPDISQQKEWIQSYKKREANGTDYYFMFLDHQGTRLGVCRIYNIHERSCTGGSWAFTPGSPTELVVASSLITRDIMFEILKLEEDNFDVRKENKKVLKFHKMSGSEVVGETELDYLFRITPERYYPKREYLINLLNLEK